MDRRAIGGFLNFGCVACGSSPPSAPSPWPSPAATTSTEWSGTVTFSSVEPAALCEAKYLVSYPELLAQRPLAVVKQHGPTALIV